MCTCDICQQTAKYDSQECPIKPVFEIIKALAASHINYRRQYEIDKILRIYATNGPLMQMLLPYLPKAVGPDVMCIILDEIQLNSSTISSCLNAIYRSPYRVNDEITFETKLMQKLENIELSDDIMHALLMGLKDTSATYIMLKQRGMVLNNKVLDCVCASISGNTRIPESIILDLLNNKIKPTKQNYMNLLKNTNNSPIVVKIVEEFVYRGLKIDTEMITLAISKNMEIPIFNRIDLNIDEVNIYDLLKAQGPYRFKYKDLYEKLKHKLDP